MKLTKTCLTLVCISAPAFALPTQCVNGPLTTYLAPAFECSIGDKTFGSFDVILSAVTVGGTATPVGAGDITVNPTGGSTDPAFSFQASFNATTGPLASVSSVTFTVAYTGFAPASDPFFETRLFLTDAAVSGLGIITSAEAVCKNGSFTSPLNPLLCSGIVVNAGLTSNITNANLGAIITFDTGPVTEMGIIKQLTLNSGVNGTATASALNNGYTAATPEPDTTMILLGLGLIVLGLPRARLKAVLRRNR